MVASNAKISSIRTRWQVGGAQVSEVDCVDCADDHLDQMRLQVCTLTSTNMILGQMDSIQTGTNVILGRMDSAQTEMMAAIQQVLTMVQQVPVRQRSRSLSMHSQVEPVGFNNQTTRVRHPPPV